MAHLETPHRRVDPLLAAGKLLARIVRIFMVAAAAAIVVAVPILLFNQAEVQRQMAEQGATMGLAAFMGRLLPLLLLALLAVGIVYRFAQLVERMIDTVDQGDPFLPENAKRLTEMAWLALAGQIAAWSIAVLAAWLSEAFPKERIVADAEFSLNGLILVLLLFILARVFRHGTALRDDLEGTV